MPASSSSFSRAAIVRTGHPLLAGISATFVTIGLHRFAYAPLLPALISAGWFSPAQASYLGAANLSGYLLGALLTPPLAHRLGTRLMLRLTMIVGAITFFACAAPLSFAWFFLWRTVSGLCGGVAMVLAAPAVAAAVPPRHHALAVGAVFGGVGLGIVVSATLVPTLLRSGLPDAWIGLGVLAVLAAAISWHGWPADESRAANVADITAPVRHDPALRSLRLAYGLAAASMVPGIVFLVDFTARHLALGLDAAALVWVWFGIGATLGPAALGAIGGRIGARTTFRLVLLIQGAATLLIALGRDVTAIAIPAFIAGALMTGIVGLAVTRTRELVPEDRAAQRRAWSGCTTAFAIAQALGAYGCSYLLARDAGLYAAMFALAAVPALAGLLIELWPARRGHGKSDAAPEAAIFARQVSPL